MATKAVKKTTSKEKIEFLQRERDQINRERIELVAEVDKLKRINDAQANTIKLLQDQLAERNNTSRHWVLRKLGL